MAPADYTPPPNLAALHQPAAAATARAGETERSWRAYTVRRGDTLSALAREHHTSVRALIERNHLTHPIKAGQHLRLPEPAPKRSKAGPAGKDATAAKKASASKKAAQRKKADRPARTLRSHTVARGEHLSGIALRYHTSVGALMKANHLGDPGSIHAGQRLRVPSAEGKKQDASSRSSGKPAATKGTSTAKAKKHPDDGKNTFAGRRYPDHVVAAADSNRAALRRASVPSRAETKDLIVEAARRHGVNPKLALAIGWQESGWNQRAVSPANAVGVMQVMPATGTWSSSLVGRDLDLRQTRDNVDAGVVMLRWLVRHADDQDQAIAGYYQGLGGVRDKGMYPDTKAYVRSVTSHMARF